MPDRIIAIGDIHGCPKALETLIERIQPTSDDLIIPLGDYIDRGDESPRVLDLLIDLMGRCELVPLLGNHEIMLLQAIEDLSNLQFWLQCGGMETVDSYGGLEYIPEDHLAFLYHCCRHVETDQYIFLHANYEADLPLDAQPDSRLFWEHVLDSPPLPHYSGKTVVVGHTPQTTGDILDLGHLICLDTHCVGDGWLTAMDVETRTIWQADKYGALRD
ncbi:MAG: metallophosphoesterase [Pirellulaceae bacterium]